MGLFAEPRCQKVGAALFVFLDPFFGEAAVADFRKNFAHFLAGLLSNDPWARGVVPLFGGVADRSEEHTSELQSHLNLVCRLLLEKKKENPLSCAAMNNDHWF